MDRRDFMRVSALGLASLGVSGLPLDASTSNSAAKDSRATDTASEDGSYSVVIIGDTHYDKAPDAVYHEGYSDPDPQREANHRKEFVRNAEMWQERMRKLVSRAARLRREDTRMAFQMGDIIQGDCGDYANHRTMLDDAYCYLKGALGGLPLVTVAGNHDLRGRDDSIATAAYNDYMCEKMTSELSKEVTKTCYSFWIGPDIYLAIDFTNPDDEEIERIFSETSGARYVFVVIHAPVLPYQAAGTANWIIYGRRNENHEKRRHFRRLLAERNAIVLCGHTHTTEFAIWEGDGGTITQMTMNSVYSSEKLGEYVERTSNPDDYGQVVLRNGKKAMKDLVNEYRPGMKAFSLAQCAGSYRLMVSDAGVKVEFYAGVSEEVTKVFTLR